MNERERLDLGDLPDEIAAHQQPMIESPHRLRRARTQLLLSARGRTLEQRAGRRSLGSLLWAPIALAAALTLAVVALRARETPLTFEVASGVSGQLGKRVQAPAAAERTVRFSDGTALALLPGSTVRVSEVGAQGADIVLENGALRANVIHRARSRWHVHAGPYRVLVTGTRFDLRWDAGQRSFALELQEGAVTVFGPSLGASGRGVLPDETLRLGGETPPVDTQAPEAAVSEVTPTSGSGPPVAAPISPSPSAPAPAPASWKSLAQAGKYAAAFVAAEREGFGSICRHSSSADLLLLGNTSRLAKKPARAEEAFLAVRARSSAAPQRALAAFQLGRLAQDIRGDHARGATWFETYLNESPAGQLAREAAGRAMEAHHRAGNAAAARLAARRYLDRYPGGPFEPLARQLLAP
jgi:ferric-dicitrate binding protein FerR (iron transport regulator)